MSIPHQKTIILILVLVFFQHAAGADEIRPPGTDANAYILPAGTAAFATGFFLYDDVTPPDSLPNIMPKVNFIDRGALNNWSEEAALFSDVLLAGLAAAPLALLSDDEIYNDGWGVAEAYLQSTLITNSAVMLSKGLFQRKRPYYYNPAAPEYIRLSKDAKRSFISGHSANAFNSALFTARVYDVYHDNDAVPYIYAAGLGLAGLTGYMRYEAGRHYPTDIIAGALAGALSAYIITEIHRHREQVIPLDEKPLYLTLMINF
ncbi:MAG: phosphatase PAP2 family protein [Candidatus Kapaibacterium sp.]